MSVTSGFFNSLSGDRKYDAIQISSMFDGLITDGIYNGYLESFMVTASSPASMVVTVGEGRCWFNHTWTLNDAPLPLTLDVGDVVLNRIDTIVIDVDSTDTVRACTIKVVKGTPSSQAVRPTLENTETHHQYPLCDISVPAGATTITQSNITNRRGTSDCPFAATLMESVSVDDLLIQWESQWNDWMTDRANAMDSWTAEQQEAFTTWFQTVQDILDQDTAGNLLNRINHRTGINATATYSAGVVAITAPDDAGEILTFVAPSDFLSSDTYTLNGEALTITDLNGEALDDSWKNNSPVTITVSGGKAFFKAGGSGKNDTLPPLLGNMTVEVVEGDENDTYTIKMDKLILDKTTEMVGGAQLEWGEEMPAKPGKGTGGIKTWTRDEIITTGKPYDGLYLGDVTPSDAVTETLLWLPENDGGSVKLVPFIVLSVDYLGGVYVMREPLSESMKATWGGSFYYPGNPVDSFLSATYLNSILDKSISDALLTCSVPVQTKSSTTAVETMDRKCWVPSYGELYDATFNDGTKMPYFNSTNRIAYINGGKVKGAYWTRTRAKGGSPYSVDTSGGMSNAYGWSDTIYIRPSFVLPKDFKIQQRPDGSYTVWNEQGLMTLGDIDASDEVSAVYANITESGKIVPMLFLNKKYGDTDGGLLLRNGIYTSSAMGSTYYENSGADTTCTTWASSVVDEVYRSKMLDITIKYYDVVSAAVQTLSPKRKAFILGSQGLNVPGADTWPEYEPINPYFNSNDRRNVGSKYWVRDKYSGNDAFTVWYLIGVGGGAGYENGMNANGIRPACVMDLDTPIRALADGTYDLVPEDPALTQTVSTLAETGTPVQLKDIPVSTAGNAVIVSIDSVEYISCQKQYQGTKGYALMKKDVSSSPVKFNSTPTGGGSPYQYSNMDTWCENTYVATLSENVQKYLVYADVPIYTTTINRRCFAPSGTELRVTAAYTEGTAFVGMVTDEDRKSNNNYFTRSRYNAQSNNVTFVGTTGGASYASQSSDFYARPVILIDEEAWAIDNNDGTYTFVGDKPVDDTPVVTYTVEVPHGQKVVFRQFTQNQKKQFQTMLVGGVYPPLGDIEPAFALPEFTGNHAIFGDEVAGRIELYESGTLTLSPGTYDFFLVGGGASGGVTTDTSVQEHTGGGGGGYTTTISDIVVSKRSEFIATVGAGGNRSAGSQTIFENGSTTIKYTANGGAMVTGEYTANGGAGGSGGGGFNRDSGNGYAGGSDGSNGLGRTGGMGQGTTTRMFGEAGNTLFSGGGGGAGDGRGYYPGAGGAGGGGAAGNNVNGVAGTANTGGGGGGYSTVNTGAWLQPGAGGSGIIIIRWDNVAQ